MNKLLKPLANIGILRRAPFLRVGTAALMATVAIAGSAYASGNAFDCESKDKPALVALDEQIFNAGNAPSSPASLAAYNALLAERLKLLAQTTQDCDAACKADKQLESSLSAQLQKLLDAKSDPTNTGPASINYEMRVKALQQQLNGVSVLAQKDCGPVNPGYPPGTGQIRPDYMILTVVYAPPGSSAGVSGMGASSVDYTTQSALGTSVGISNSFTNKVDVDATLTGKFFGTGTSLEVDFSSTTDRTDKSEIDVTKTEKGEVKISGPNFDGVDHDADQIYLWLNPVVTLNQTEQGASWTLDVDGPAMIVNYAEVGWLKNPATMPPGVLAAFQKAGIKPSDYATILSADPFANGATKIDPSRYIELSESYPFEPVDSATATPGSHTVTLSSETKKTSSTAVTETTNLTITVGFSVGSDDFVSAALKVSDSFTYTHSKSLQASTDTTQSAAFTIGQPAFGYTGGASIFVYWDTIFQTFMFTDPSVATAPIIMTGSVITKKGGPVIKKPVTVSIDGQEYKTMTDSKGVYKIYGLEKSTPGKLVVGAVSVGGKSIAVEPKGGSAKRDLVVDE